MVITIFVNNEFLKLTLLQIVLSFTLKLLFKYVEETIVILFLVEGEKLNNLCERN